MMTHNWLRPFREAKGFTQSELAEKISANEKTIQRWETYRIHKRIPFHRLAKILEVSEEELREAHKAGLEKHKNRQRERSEENTPWYCPEKVDT